MVDDFPVLSTGPTPHVPVEDWSLTIDGAVTALVSRSRHEFRELPSETFTVDIHCVTKWSKLGTTWSGVSLDRLLQDVATKAEFVSASRRWLHDEPAAGGSDRRQEVGGRHVRGRATGARAWWSGALLVPIVWRLATVTDVVAETGRAKTLGLDVPAWPGHVAASTSTRSSGDRMGIRPSAPTRSPRRPRIVAWP